MKPQMYAVLTGVRSPQEQVRRLDFRLGKDKGAIKERRKLAAMIAHKKQA